MPDVFISYSRKDIAFARLISESLQQSQVDTWIDWERIPVGEKWWTEICEAIQNANVFMFIISRNSISSSVCKDEIDWALKNNKRIIPIIVDELQPAEVKEFVPDLPQFNWIIFERDQIFHIQENPEARPDRPEDGQVALPLPPQFEEALQKLSLAIHTDWEWVKYHTHLQVNARQWESNQRNPGYLLRGSALEESEQQLLRASEKEPKPTDLQVEYVTASRKEESVRQQEKLKLEQKARGRQRLVIWAVGIGLAAAIVLGGIALGQRNLAISQSDIRATAEANAIDQRTTAEAASTMAIDQRNEAERQAKIALSSQLSAQSQSLLANQLDLAMLLAGESYQTADTYNSRSSLVLALEQSPQLARIFRYPEKITALAFSPDGKWLAAAGCAKRNENHDTCLKNEIIFHDLVGGQTGQILEAGAGRLTGLAFTPDGSALFAAIAGDRIYRFNLSAEDQPAPVPLPVFPNSSGTVVISTDGKFMASAGCNFFMMPGGLCSQGGLVLWDLGLDNPSGNVLKGVGTEMHNLAFSSYSDRLFAGDCAGVRTENIGKTSQDYCSAGKVKTWNLSDGSMQEYPVEGTTSAIISVDVSTDGKLLAAGEAAGIVHIIDLENWKQVAVHSLRSEIESLLFSRATSDQFLVSLSFSLENPLVVLFAKNPSSNPLILEPYLSTQLVDALAISLDGHFLASSSCTGTEQSLVDCKQGNIYLWNMFSWQPVEQVFTSTDGAKWTNWQVGFDPSNPQDPVVLAVSSQQIDQWDVDRNQPAGEPILSAEKIDSAFISLDHSGKVLAYPELIQGRNSSLTSRMHFVDVATRHEIGTPVMVDGWALEAIFSPDDRWMVSNGPAKTLLVWDPSSGKVVRQLSMDLKPGFIELAFSPDGSTLAAAGCVQGFQSCQTYQIVFYDMKTGNAVGKLIEGETNGSVSQLVFSPDGKKVGIRYFVSNNSQDTWWDIQTGQIDPQMSSLPVGQFSPDGRSLVSISCVSGSWGAISSSCGVGLIALWDVQKQAPIGRPIRNPDGKVTFLGFSPDSRFLYTSGIGKLTVWSLDPQDWLLRVCQVANRNLTQEEWSMYLNQVAYHPTCTAHQ